MQVLGRQRDAGVSPTRQAHLLPSGGPCGRMNSEPASSCGTAAIAVRSVTVCSSSVRSRQVTVTTSDFIGGDSLAVTTRRRGIAGVDAGDVVGAVGDDLGIVDDVARSSRWRRRRASPRSTPARCAPPRHAGARRRRCRAASTAGPAAPSCRTPSRPAPPAPRSARHRARTAGARSREVPPAAGQAHERAGAAPDRLQHRHRRRPRWGAAAVERAPSVNSAPRTVPPPVQPPRV